MSIQSAPKTEKTNNLISLILELTKLFENYQRHIGETGTDCRLHFTGAVQHEKEFSRANARFGTLERRQFKIFEQKEIRKSVYDK